MMTMTMATDLKVVACGFVVGILIGMTGMGGGTVMTPLMLFMFHMHAAVAVGTDLLYSSVTKLVGSIQHIRQKTVDFVAFRWLSYGSVPGSIGGSLVVGLLLRHEPASLVNLFVGRALGAVYILAIAAMLWKRLASQRQISQVTQGRVDVPRFRLTVLGIIAGFIVGCTSVGSGSLFIVVLGLLYPIAMAKLVGTDILQGMLVTGVAGLTHLAFGNVNLEMAGILLIGSIPGILLGSRFTVSVPESWLKTAILMMLGWSSLNLLLK